MAAPDWTTLIAGSRTRVVTFYSASTSPFTKLHTIPIYGDYRDNRVMTKADIVYYLDVVSSPNLNSFSNTQAIPWPYLSSATVYNNVQKSGSFTRTNCGTGYTGGTATYVVAAGTYTNTTSQASVDALAQADVDANGQAWVNAGGASCNLRATAWRGTSPFCVTNDTTTTGTLNWSYGSAESGNLFTIVGGGTSVSTSSTGSGTMSVTSSQLIQVKLATPVYNPLSGGNGVHLVVSGTGLSYDKIIYDLEGDFVAFYFSYNPSMGTITVTAGTETY
jgi:hypothetical protein